LETVEIPTPKPCTLLFLVLSSIQWYVGHDPWGQPHPPRKGKLLNILRTFEISTPKPQIFLFLALMGIQWHVGHDHPQEREITAIYRGVYIIFHTIDFVHHNIFCFIEIFDKTRNGASFENLWWDPF
jgi:hypothetical protein